MLLPAPPLYPRKKKAPKVRIGPPPAAPAPVLVAATFSADTLAVSLTFDRAIDITGFELNGIVVFDGNLGIEWGGTAEFWQDNPQQLGMIMIEQGEYTGEGYKLSAIGGAGIKALDDGVPWAGVTDVVLPFP